MIMAGTVQPPEEISVEHRWVLLYSNVLNSKLRFIWTVIKITLLFLICQTAHSNQNSSKQKDLLGITFFQESAWHLYCHIKKLHNHCPQGTELPQDARSVFTNFSFVLGYFVKKKQHTCSYFRYQMLWLGIFQLFRKTQDWATTGNTARWKGFRILLEHTGQVVSMTVQNHT